MTTTATVSRRISTVLILGAVGLMAVSAPRVLGAQGGWCDAYVQRDIVTGALALQCQQNGCATACTKPSMMHNNKSYRTCACPEATPQVACNAGQPLEAGDTTPVCLNPEHCAGETECTDEPTEDKIPEGEPNEGQIAGYYCECK